MPRKQPIRESIYMDEAEGFILEHALFSPRRTWPPLPPDSSSSIKEDNLNSSKKKMDWEEEIRNHPDEPIDIPIKKHSNFEEGDEEDPNKERCVICLMNLKDRTVVGLCGHEFCFDCIGIWANQSRRCPLCSADMASFLLHDLDAVTPTKFYLPPLPSKSIPSAPVAGPSRTRFPQITRRERAEELEKEEPDELDLQVERRKEKYRHELYVKHIGSNKHTKFRPNPTPKQISEDPNLVQRATVFLRRELRIWLPNIDIEFLITYIISLLKIIDIRSEPAIRLLTDYLNLNQEFPNNPTEHFSHELYSFLRSPFKDLRKWDEAIQYDPIPSAQSQRPKSLSPGPSHRARSRSLSISRSSSISYSHSPSPPVRIKSESRSQSPPSPRSSPNKRGRQWSKRDVFIPSVSPDGKRWDENDTWLDPEYAEWLDEEKRREEDRRERKRLRRISEIEKAQNRNSQKRQQKQDQIQKQRQKPMRAWGNDNQVKVEPEEGKRVELLPEVKAEDLPSRSQEMVKDPKDVQVEVNGRKEIEPTYRKSLSERISSGGLSIKGAARPVEPVAPIPPIPPTEPRRQRVLLEKLAREKAASVSVTAEPGSVDVIDDGNKKISLEEMKLKLLKLKAMNRARAKTENIPPIVNGTARKLSLAEKLANLKAEQANNGIPVTTSPIEEKPVISPPPIIHSKSDPTYGGSGGGGLTESIRRRKSIKSKLKNEKDILIIRNDNESKAQELRRRLIERRTKKENLQVERLKSLKSRIQIKRKQQQQNNEENNITDSLNDESKMENEGIIEVDEVLLKMNYEERKKELRRRLMKLKMLNAETDSERKQRELKEKLLLNKKKKGNGVII
ncbi:uncharacterized protein L201_002368 [Kwoniella dendrophila CBS 6074]|uniref:RING-type E3 ubiquitin transferase n=1 Tax=Kwoniella dendrophila CBS 6074 TaxID=1295534 RepID=A0AAX4JQ22_9TREE